MSITVSEYAGFCPGVRKADKLVHKILSESNDGERVYTLGSLIHNRIYNQELRDKGVLAINITDVERI